MSKSKNISPLSLKKNFSWTMLGNIIYAITQFGILIVLNRFGNVEAVGIYTLGLALISPTILLTNLQLRSIQATDNNLSRFVFNDYLSLRIISSLVALLFLYFILNIFDYEGNVIIIVLLLSIAKVIESISDVGHGLLQKKEKMDVIAKSKIFKGALSLIIIFFNMWLTNSLLISILNLILSWSIVLIFYDYYWVKKITIIQPKFNVKKMYSLFKFALPLGIVTMIGSLTTNLPRYFIENYINVEALGYFASISYIMVAGTTVISALGQAATPRLAQYYASGKISLFKSLLSKLVLFGSFVGVIGIVFSYYFGEDILILLYGIEYKEYSDLFILVMVAAFFSYTSSSLGYAMTSTRHFKIQPYLGVFWLGMALIACLILIPNYGLAGATYVLIFNSILQLVVKAIVVIVILKKSKINN